ncbi:hypothetical protein [Alteromonas sp. 14N.309.X.WAT.G.H12]|uniref:hypothetical protein n=1 Tax=Alteromonas sp. 14N.309.X.WAT.G.H12 TaxID=3120824 RepID=UPI002FD6F0D1
MSIRTGSALAPAIQDKKESDVVDGLDSMVHECISMQAPHTQGLDAQLTDLGESGCAVNASLRDLVE